MKLVCSTFLRSWLLYMPADILTQSLTRFQLVLRNKSSLSDGMFLRCASLLLVRKEALLNGKSSYLDV